MKKIMIAILGFCLCIIIDSTARGENYVSTTFPPDEILTRAFTISVVPKKIIGKHKLHEDKYTVYYHDADSNMIGSAEVVRLDNNSWIAVISSGSYGHVIHVIQK